MKRKIISSDIIFSNIIGGEKYIHSVIVKWQESENIIIKKQFTYEEIIKNEIFFTAFKKHHPEFFV
jgi:hypothetical protein